MKINFVVPSIGVAGGIRVVFEFANRLSERGHDVTILYPTVPSRMPASWVAPRPRLTQALGTLRRLVKDEAVDWFDLDAEIKQFPSLTPSLNNIIEYFIPNADVTVATSWQTAYLVAALSESKGKKAYFVQHYEVWPLWNCLSCWKKANEFDGAASINMTKIVPEDRYLEKYKGLVDRSYELPLDLIITSEWERKILQKLGHDFVGKVKYGVNFEMFYPEEQEDDNKTVLALYRNSPEKGDKQVIKTFENLYEEHPAIEYIMFGTNKGDDIPDFVEFYENPQQSVIRSLYSRADIMVYLSWVEGYGMPPMEAMACKTAIVSTKVGAVEEYSPEGYVHFVPIQKTVPAVEAVKKLLSNPAKIEMMKYKCYDHIQQFTWETATNQFEACISQATE